MSSENKTKNNKLVETSSHQTQPRPCPEHARTDSLQLIRDGAHSVAELMAIGKTMLGRRHVQPAVVNSLSELMVEGTFPTGTYLVTVHHPISSDDGDLEKALYGSFLPVPSKDAFPLEAGESDVYTTDKQPGAVVAVKGAQIVLKEGRHRIRLKVTSKGDRPIQVGCWCTWWYSVETCWS